MTVHRLEWVVVAVVTAYAVARPVPPPPRAAPTPRSG
jgi:hypothetical protein